MRSHGLPSGLRVGCRDAERGIRQMGWRVVSRNPVGTERGVLMFFSEPPKVAIVSIEATSKLQLLKGKSSDPCLNPVKWCMGATHRVC